MGVASMSGGQGRGGLLLSDVFNACMSDGAGIVQRDGAS